MTLKERNELRRKLLNVRRENLIESLLNILQATEGKPDIQEYAYQTGWYKQSIKVIKEEIQQYEAETHTISET